MFMNFGFECTKFSHNEVLIILVALEFLRKKWKNYVLTVLELNIQQNNTKIIAYQKKMLDIVTSLGAKLAFEN